MKIGEYVQQGDVLVKKIKALPSDLAKQDTKILQESETTGHHHHFMQDAPVTVYQRNAQPSDDKTITPNFGKYIVLDKAAFLYHGKVFEKQPAKSGTGDHDALKIPAGIYEIDIVREYDYDRNEAVRVVD